MSHRLTLALVACAAILSAAQVSCAQSLYPGALDSSVNLPPVSAGNVITSGESNTQSEALFNIQRAIGADATLATTNILQRLAGKANTSDLENLNPKVLASTLNAGAYAGGDIGAKVNAAVADCTTKLGSAAALCRITIPPGVYSQTTAIKIGRAKTLLDCQGAVLLPSSGFTDIPIRLNYPTAGSQASEISDIGVHNCFIDSGLQTSMSSIVGTDTGDNGNPRIGSLVAWKVANIDLQNVRVKNSFGPGVAVFQSRGWISRVYVSVTRIPYSGGNAAGVYVSGSGYGGGANGLPVTVTSARIDTSATYGIWAVAGAILRDLDIRDTQSACVALGGAETQGWISVSDFNLSDCTLGATAKMGAIDDAPAGDFASDPVQYVAISRGTIRRSRSDGVLLGAADSYAHIAVQDVTIECWGSAFSASRAIFLQHGGSDYTVQSNHISHPAGCAAQSGAARGIEVAGAATAVAIAGNTVSAGTYGILLSNGPDPLTSVVVRDNIVQSTTNSPIWLNLTATSDFNQDIEVSGNHFASVCTDASDCGMVLLTVPASGGVYGLAITGNVGLLDLGSTEYGLETNVDPSYGTFANVIFAGNLLYSSANSDHTILHQSLDVSTRIQIGTLTSNGLSGTLAGNWVRLKKSASGTSNLGNKAVCLNSDGTINLCDDGGAANRVVGIGVNSISDNAYGYVQVSGFAHAVGCTDSGGSGGGGAIAPGDLLIRSSSTDGRVMGSTSPGVGEVIGKALTTCSAANLDMIVGVTR